MLQCTMNFTYPHVEDYIEIIAGYRLPDGKPNHSIFVVPEPLISLARYDTKVVESLSDQTLIKKIAYTDKQAKLAHGLVIKYERQLLKHKIDVSTVQTPVYRMSLRDIDRTTRVWIEGDEIRIKFPYDTKLIDQVREASKTSCGRISFDRELRYWVANLTEYNLNWVYAFSKTNNFMLDESVTTLMDALLLIETTPYKIELTPGEHLTIKNAEASLIEYVNEHLGGFTDENLLTLIDYAPVLGYQVHETIKEVVDSNYGSNFWAMCSNKEIKADVKHMEEIIKYATETDRFPIFVYEPDLSSRLFNEITRWYSSEQIVTLGIGKNESISIDPNVKIIYANKIPKFEFGTIPLLLSGAGMLFGGDKEIWLQSSEKVVFFSKDVYNKQKRGREVCRLD